MKASIRKLIDAAPPYRPGPGRPRAKGHPHNDPDHCEMCKRRHYVRQANTRSRDRRNPRLRFERARRLREAIRRGGF